MFKKKTTKKKDSKKKENFEREHRFSVPLLDEIPPVNPFEECMESAPFRRLGTVVCTQKDVDERNVVAIKDTQDMVKFTRRSTVYGLNGDEPTELCCIYRSSALRDDDAFGEVLFCIPQDLYDSFSDMGDISEISEALEYFFDCTESQQKYIMDSRKLSTSENKSSSSRTVVTDETGLKMMYKMVQKSLSPNIDAKCRELLEQRGFSNKIKGDNLQILSDILHTCIPVKNTPELPSFDECMAILNKYRYGDRDLKEAIVQRIRLLARSDTRGTVIALLGQPGVGKTSLGKGIAECLRKNFCFIDCKDCEVLSIGGTPRTYDGAQHGMVMDVLVHNGTDCCIMLDEYDKMRKSADKGDPYSIFIPVWDDRKEFTDFYTNVPVPVENVCWILTFNTINEVPEFIKNRFAGNIFTIESYDVAKKAEICKRFIFP